MLVRHDIVVSYFGVESHVLVYLFPWLFGLGNLVLGGSVL